ncbi:ribbon-helix-helix protein, CopG family, partial [Microcoleus sp. F8-D1]
MRKMPMVKKNRNVVSSNSDSKVKVGLSLTSSSADRLNTIARKLGISRSELLERLAQGALDISKDKTEVTVTWKKGEETQVEAAHLQGETAEKTEVNDAVTAETLSDSVSVKPNPLQESYESLQQQLSERESSIASLQQQLAAEKQNLESQLQETVAKSSYESLQQQLSERESSIAS